MHRYSAEQMKLHHLLYLARNEDDILKKYYLTYQKYQTLEQHFAIFDGHRRSDDAGGGKSDDIYYCEYNRRGTHWWGKDFTMAEMQDTSQSLEKLKPDVLRSVS